MTQGTVAVNDECKDRRRESESSVCTFFVYVSTCVFLPRVHVCVQTGVPVPRPDVCLRSCRPDGGLVWRRWLDHDAT